MVARGTTAAQTLLQDQDVLTVFLQTHRVGLHVLGTNTHTYKLYSYIGMKTSAHYKSKMFSCVAKGPVCKEFKAVQHLKEVCLTSLFIFRSLSGGLP